MRALLFLSLLWAGTQVAAQKLEPTSLRYPDSLRGGSSVVLESDISYEVTGLNSATYRYRKVITLLDSEQEHGNTLVEGYDADSKITNFEAASYDFLGNEIDRARSKDVQDRRYTSEGNFYQDTRYQYVSVPCSSYPCTVVFEVEKQLNDFSMVGALDSWQPQRYEQGVVRSSFTVSVPLENELLYRLHGLPEPRVTTDRVKTYHWEVHNLPPQEQEPYAPSATETLPYIRLALANFSIEGYRGSYRSWNDFGIFMNSLLDGRDVLPTRLKQEVREVVDGATTEREKIDRLYRHMQSRMRYVSIQLGVGGWQPFSAEYVEQNRFGDCKALSNYMGAMLKEVGIASYPVLINADAQQHYAVDQQFTTAAFNHMVLYVPGEEMYLECTSHTAPSGYLSEDMRDRNVLWVTPQGGELHHIPPADPTANASTRTVDVTVTERGTAAVSINSTFYGGLQEAFRGLADYEQNQTEQVKRLHAYDLLPDVSGTGYALSVHPDTAAVGLRYRTEVNNYFRKMGSRLFVPINPYYGYTSVPEDNADRQLPVEILTSRFFVDTVNIHLPAGLEIESGLNTEPVIYQHARGEYRAQMTPTDDGLQWVRTLKLNPVHLPAEAYADLRQFYLDVSKAERAQIVVREKRTK